MLYQLICWISELPHLIKLCRKIHARRYPANIALGELCVLKKLSYSSFLIFRAKVFFVSTRLFRSLRVLEKYNCLCSGAKRNMIFKMSPCNLYCWVRFSRNDVWKVIVLLNKCTSMLFGDYYFI